MVSSNILRMGIQKTPFQKTYKMQIGSQEFTLDFKGCYRQFDWPEISLVYDKSNKHLTIHDSYNVECATRIIKNTELTNISDSYSVTNTINFDTSNNT